MRVIITLIARICAIVSYSIALICSAVLLKKNRRPLYFKCAFYGLLPLGLAAFFRLAQEGNSFIQSEFSLGLLGEVSAYLFVIAANTSLIVKEEIERKSYFSLPGYIFAGVGLILLALPVCVNFSAVRLLSALLYAVAMCPCLYYAAEVCVNRFHNPFKDGLKKFNILVIVHIYATALFLYVPILPDPAGDILTAVCALGWAASVLPGMLLLKKGLEPWEI